MKTLIAISGMIASASLFPGQASAADLYEDGAVEGVIVDDGPGVVVERERFVERRYYGTRRYVDAGAAIDVYDDEPGYRGPYGPDRRYWRVYEEW